MIALPPTNSTFTLAFRARVPLSLSLDDLTKIYVNCRSPMVEDYKLNTFSCTRVIPFLDSLIIVIKFRINE